MSGIIPPDDYFLRKARFHARISILMGIINLILLGLYVWN